MTRKIVLSIFAFIFFTIVIAFSQETKMEKIKKSCQSKVPGVVIDYSPAVSGKYIGSPSIAILPNGHYVASHDFFGPEATNTTNGETSIFLSEDGGKTWQYLTELKGQYWSSLFVHNGALYIMGTTCRWGSVVIRRSTDGGKIWTTPKDSNSGLLLDDGRYHTAPVPIVIHQGHLWRSMEVDDNYPEAKGNLHPYRSFVMSIPVEAELLEADNWIKSNYLRYDPSRVGGKRGGWREGNIVITPQNRIVNTLRINDIGPDKADILRISDDGTKIFFDKNLEFVDFPGGGSKFTIRYDEKTQCYWSLVNKKKNEDAYRNILALTSSPDLINWTVESIILRHEDKKHHAFQYVDWLFEGNDIIAVSRTAWDGSHNAHDANYMTFHRIHNFRQK